MRTSCCHAGMLRFSSWEGEGEGWGEGESEGEGEG